MRDPVVDRLAERLDLFTGKRILVVGDIAFDRTIRCIPSPEGRHARHAREQMYDVVPGGDDFGAVGASNNTCMFCSAVGASTTLVAVTGADPEGERVAAILAREGVTSRLLRLPGIQTVTRVRYFAPREEAGQDEMLYRFDKDPDTAVSSLKALEAIESGDFLEWFEREVEKSDAVLFNDTDKGFLSPAVLEVLRGGIDRVRSGRRDRALTGPLVVVDPKVEWTKYGGLRVDILKPNHVEACKAIGWQVIDPAKKEDLRALGCELAVRMSDRFPLLVVTCGAHGAIVVQRNGRDAIIRHHHGIPAMASPDGAATHCGDVFVTSLTLALTVGAHVDDAVDFANYAASVQYGKPAGEKVGLADLVSAGQRAHLAAHVQPSTRIAELHDLG